VFGCEDVVGEDAHVTGSSRGVDLGRICRSEDCLVGENGFHLIGNVCIAMISQ